MLRKGQVRDVSDGLQTDRPISSGLFSLSRILRYAREDSSYILLISRISKQIVLDGTFLEYRELFIGKTPLI